jgi:hypothetical protein
MMRTHWEQGKDPPKEILSSRVEGMDLTKEAAHHIHWYAYLGQIQH